MNILLVNDDGYKAKGIRELERVLVEKGHRVYVSAPSDEQSAKSHSMTIDGTRYATKYKEGHFHIDGTPADCIIYGLKSGLIDIKPDVVISGINHGYNLSTDIIYSGTCGAARQASLYGYKAIAISTYRDENSNKYSFSDCALFLEEHLEQFLSQIHSDVFLNINIPPNFNGEYGYASIGEIRYDDRFRIEEEDRDRYKITNIGCDISYHSLEKSKFPNDFELCNRGFASVSFVKLFPQSSCDHI